MVRNSRREARLRSEGGGPQDSTVEETLACKRTPEDHPGRYDERAGTRWTLLAPTLLGVSGGAPATPCIEQPRARPLEL